MTNNPWLPIDTMPLSTVGTDVDLCEGRRLYSGVTVSGIKLVHNVVEEGALMQHPSVYVGSIDDFTIITTTGAIRVRPGAEWRAHV